MTEPGGIGGALGKLFGEGTIGQQLLVWQVLGQLVQPFVNPMAQTLTSDIWTVDPNVPVSPSIMAALVARGLVTPDDGVNESSKSGVGKPQFDRMVKAARDVPTLAELVELVNRGMIPLDGAPGGAPSMTGALIESGQRPEWVAELIKLRTHIPTAADALNALLQGQIAESEARDLWAKNGMDPAYFTMMFDANGTAPTPVEAATMANRGIIPWTGTGPNAVSFEQAFLEGPWRNKWEPSMRALAEYLPPPRTVTAMVHDGSLTDAQALALWEKQGLSPELAAAYLKSAHHARQASTKELARTDVVNLYKAHKIDKATAEQHLTGLGYTSADAELILSLADVVKADTHLTAAINKVHALYVAHKITEQAAHTALTDLRLPTAQATELLTLWQLERGVNVRLLTEAQIVAAFKHTIMAEDEARAELVALGYTEYDAWVLLSISNAGPLPNKPVPGSGPGVNP